MGSSAFAAIWRKSTCELLLLRPARSYQSNYMLDKGSPWERSRATRLCSLPLCQRIMNECFQDTRQRIAVRSQLFKCHFGSTSEHPCGAEGSVKDAEISTGKLQTYLHSQ